MLGSGSRGNALLLECAGSRVLIDAGFSPRVLSARLAEIGVAGESIEAVIVTHEHTDHVRGARACAKRWGWELYATAGTTAAYGELANGSVHTFVAGDTLELSEMSLRSVPTPHDAAEPVAFVATARRSGMRTGIAYDIGHVTTTLRSALTELDLLVLESNHDREMLRNGPYPRIVQTRIAGLKGHLSNDDAAVLASECAHTGLEHVVLAHLSQKCNRPTLAKAAVAGALKKTAFRGRVTAAHQDRVAGPFMAEVRQQLNLGL
jgi:phosphoribosyl 1,2-cyclic phosphodiesterase